MLIAPRLLRYSGVPRRGLLLLLAIALGVGGTAVAVSRLVTAAKADPWPSFVMVYQDSTFGASPFTQVFRLTYVDSRHYTTMLTAHSAVPEAVGWTHTVDGNVSRTVDSRLGPMPTGSFQPDEQLIPDFWIRPDTRPVWLANRPTAVTERLPGGLARVTDAVKLEGGRVDSETLTYRESDGIPVLYVQTLDGKELRRIEVLTLTIGN
jgi:hypothetical protein